jgi:DNA polymerase III epsilon subunit-like protein
MTGTFLIFDTETTGLPPRAPRGAPPIPADDPRQPRMASFAGIIADDLGNTISEQKFYVKPEGWTMAAFDAMAIAAGKKPASEVNGLTDDLLNERGIPVREVLDFYTRWISSGLIAVAHNAVFDKKIMRGELRRAGMSDLFDKTRSICTMRAMDPYAERGLCMSSPGFVRLQVACDFHGIPLTDAHDAMADARGAQGLLQALIRDRLLPEPSIDYAANRAA